MADTGNDHTLPKERSTWPGRYLGAGRLALAAPVLVMAMAAIALVWAAWAMRGPSAYRLDLGDPRTGASHFYAPEKSDDRSFRWSRSLSAVSLPLVASSQVISITANPGREAGASGVHLRVYEGVRQLADFSLSPGWGTYTMTVGGALGPGLRLWLDSDTFYPDAADRRRLGVAVSEVATEPAAGRTGLIAPPRLMLALPVALVLAGFSAGLLRSRRAALLGAALSGLLACADVLVAPVRQALPAMAWMAGLAGALAAAAHVFRWLSPGSAVYGRIRAALLSRFELLWVGIGSLLLGVAMTWPLAAHLADMMPGWPGDNFAFLYKFWWFRQALTVTPRWPLFDPNSFAPFGFNLGQGEPTLINTLPGVPLGALFGDVAAYNLIALLSFAVSGIGGYLLAREISGRRSVGVFGAVAFAVCPYRMSQLAGHIQLLGTGWIALAFFAGERAIRRLRPRYGALAGLFLALSALSAWYYGFIAGLLLALYVLFRAWQVRRSLGFTPLLKTGLAGLGILLLVAGPAALPSLSLWGEGRLSHTAKAADEHSAAPVDYAIPNPLQPVWGEPGLRAHANQNVIESSLYLGLPVSLLGILGVAVLVRRKEPSEGVFRARAWLAVLITAFVLSLGLTLHDTNGQVEVSLAGGSAPVPLPASVLYDWLPLFSSMRAYARFGLVAFIAVLALAALGLPAVQDRWPRRRAFVALAFTIAVLVDFATVPYAWGLSRVRESAADTYLRAAPPGTVMVMPLTAALTGPSLYAAAEHGKPVAYGYDTFEPAQWRDARPVLATFPSEASLSLLTSWGVKYVVVSANAYGADWPGTLAFLQSLPRLGLLGVFPDERGWWVDPRVVDARPDMETYLDPDTWAVFELR